MSTLRRSVVVWTRYMRYRAALRGFDLDKIENIVRHSAERYLDVATGRFIVVGRHDETLVMVPYDMTDGDIVPVTVHTVTRQQINFRIKTGRFVNA